MVNLRNALIALFCTYSCCLLLAQDFNKYNYARHSISLTALSLSDSIVKKKQASKAQTMRLRWQKFQYKVKRQISPMGGFKGGGVIIKNGDSCLVSSVELGAGLTRGYINVWDPVLGFVPSGCNWQQVTRTFISFEYRWLRALSSNQLTNTDVKKFNPVMMNVGVSGAKGGMIFLLPAPFAIEGMAGLSTDFRDVYVRGRVGWNLIWFSLNVGGYYSLTQRATKLNNPNYTFIEFSFNIWRNNRYR